MTRMQRESVGGRGGGGVGGFAVKEGMNEKQSFMTNAVEMS